MCASGGAVHRRTGRWTAVSGITSCRKGAQQGRHHQDCKARTKPQRSGAFCAAADQGSENRGNHAKDRQKSPPLESCIRSGRRRSFRAWPQRGGGLSGRLDSEFRRNRRRAIHRETRRGESTGCRLGQVCAVQQNDLIEPICWCYRDRKSSGLPGRDRSKGR